MKLKKLISILMIISSASTYMGTNICMAGRQVNRSQNAQEKSKSVDKKPKKVAGPDIDHKSIFQDGKVICPNCGSLGSLKVKPNKPLECSKCYHKYYKNKKNESWHELLFDYDPNYSHQGKFCPECGYRKLTIDSKDQHRFTCLNNGCKIKFHDSECDVKKFLGFVSKCKNCNGQNLYIVNRKSMFDLNLQKIYYRCYDCKNEFIQTYNESYAKWIQESYDERMKRHQN